jgi:hypothetical protein
MPKGKRTNEPVKVVAHSVRYGVQDERLYTSISGFEIRQQDEPPALTDSFITVEFGPTVSKTSAITALRMVLEKRAWIFRSAEPRDLAYRHNQLFRADLVHPRRRDRTFPNWVGRLPFR